VIPELRPRGIGEILDAAVSLYRARFGRHFDTADSVREASLDFIRERRARGQSTNPFYWAGFVAAGDWR